jgi:hypothetical protein
MVKRNAYRLLVREPKIKRPLGILRGRCVNTIKTKLGEMGKSGMDWIALAQDRDRWRALMNAVKTLRVSQYAGTFLSSFTREGPTRRAHLKDIQLKASSVTQMYKGIKNRILYTGNILLFPFCLANCMEMSPS